MGLVLAFQNAPRTASRPTASRRAPVQGADILFFTGVRYERHDQAKPGETSRAPERPVGPQPAS